MENNELQQNAVSPPTDLLITCSNTEVAPLQDAANQQVSTLTEEYHFIDQDGQSIHYEIQGLHSTSPQMMILTSESENGQVFHVIPSSQSGTAQLIIPHGQIQGFQDHLEQSNEHQQCPADNAVLENTGSFIIHSSTPLTMSKKAPNGSPTDLFQRPLPPLPPNIPVWARRLRDCERIGDSFRGYCLSEAELRSILAQHKQQTQSVWGTRQSPSPAKLATRLMWKSQYVPYDGIPFVNAGSRAIVMECQYGPRRKGTQPKKNGESESLSGQIYKATCPARIYIKKVKKFPIYRVPTDPKIDKKLIRMEQEKAFNMLRKDMDGIDGVLRWYVQLPNQDAHQYHNLETGCFSPSPSPFQQAAEEEEEILCEENSIQPSRLHPRVAEKIRELVACGIDEVYSVRKQLRKFVERELFKPDEIPERHNVSFFPTVNDLKNHIHEAQRSMGNGELIYDSDTIPGAVREFNWTSESGNVLNEMVTVTFDSTSQEEQESLIKGEDSPSEDVTQNTVQLISSLTSLQPKIFAQLQGLQLQPSFTSPDGQTALITLNQPASSFTSPEGTTAVITVSPTTPVNASCLLNSGGNSQPLVLSHLHSQQNDSPVSSVVTLPDSTNNLVSMGQLVTVEDGAGVTGEVHQILLGEIHSIPIQIVESQPTIVEVNTVNTFGTDRTEKVHKEACGKQLSTAHDKSVQSQDPA